MNLNPKIADEDKLQIPDSVTVTIIIVMLIIGGIVLIWNG